VLPVIQYVPGWQSAVMQRATSSVVGHGADEQRSGDYRSPGPSNSAGDAD
jgi:hypothetical protein